MPGLLENYIANLIESYVGRYVKNLERNQLHVSIFKGDVVLENLELKDTALQELALPVPLVVHRGVLGKLKLTIPWSKLQRKPVVCDITDVALVVKPRKAGAWDEVEEQKLEQERKQQGLLDFEKERERRARAQNGIEQDKGSEEPEGKAGYVSKIHSAIVNNLQFHVHNVHVRYEDTVTDAEDPFAIGLMFKHLSCMSADQNWSVNFVQSAAICKVMHKVTQLRRFSAYVEPHLRQPLGRQLDMPACEFCSAMSKMISDHAQKGFHVLEPIDGFQKMTFQRGKPDLTIPQILLDTLFDKVQLRLTRKQYICILRLNSYANNFSKTNRFRKFMPPCRPLEDPRAWWRFAFDGVLLMIREKKQRTRFTWESIKHWKTDTMRYVVLHKMRQMVEWLPAFTSAHESEVAELEHKLDLNVLIALRKTAYAQLLQEEQEYRKKLPEPKGKKKKKLLFFRKSSANKKKKKMLDLPDPTLDLSEEEKADLLSQLGLTGEEEEVDKSSLPSDYVDQQFAFHLSSGVFSLSFNDHDDRTSTVLNFSDFTFNFLHRAEGSFKSITTLENFEVQNMAHRDTLFPCLLQRGSDSRHRGAVLLAFCLESHAPNSADTDFSVVLHMRPLDIVVDPHWIGGIAAFFAIPHTLATDSARVEMGRRTAKQQLRAVLEAGQTVSVDCNLHAPTFVIPENPRRRDGHVLFVDLGTLCVQSDVGQIKTRKERMQCDGENSEEDTYEHYSVRLANLNALVTTTDEVLRRGAPAGHKLIEQFDVNVQALRSLIERDDMMPLFKFVGDIAQLKVHLARNQVLLINRIVHAFMQALYSAVPDGTDPGSPAPNVADPAPLSESVLSYTAHVVGPAPAIPEHREEAATLHQVAVKGTQLVLYQDTVVKTVLELRRGGFAVRMDCGGLLLQVCCICALLQNQLVPACSSPIFWMWC